MFLLILAYVGGILTIVSPCVVPVLPFVFARADRPFMKNGLPLLIGMTVTFAVVATLAAFGGGWAVHANQYGRMAALIVLGILGVTLISRRVAGWLTRPVVALGNRLSRRLDGADSVAGSVGLGIATGLLWAPCAGPILGLILAGAAIQGASAQTTFLLLAYAAGAATSLACALLIGGGVFAWMKRALGAGEWVRRGLGAMIVVAVVTIALGLDTRVLARVSLPGTNAIEQQLLTAVSPQKISGGHAVKVSDPPADSSAATPTAPYPVEGRMPPLDGATHWINSAPLTRAKLRGKVVLIDFWTYSCINCIRTLPYVSAWYQKYKTHGLVIIGVHTPEFAFEKQIGNVAGAIKRFHIHYPVAMDDDYAVWRAFDNHYWPADYFVDALGRVRTQHFGEGGYRDAEDTLRALLKEAGYRDLPGGYVQIHASGAEAQAPYDRRSPETYVGYARAEGFAGSKLIQDEPHRYAVPATLLLNQWAFGGRWNDHAHRAELLSGTGSISYHFHGRDLHLVLGPGASGKPLRFRVTLDGHAPGVDHGADTDAQGYGVVNTHRLYQLVRQHGGSTRDQVMSITFFAPGVQAYAFTFG